MNLSPLSAKDRQEVGQFLLDAVHHLQRHPMAFPEFWRAVRAVQHKHGLTIRRDDVDMGRAVIVHIDPHAQAIEAKDSRHWWVYNLIAWVFQVVAVGVKYTFLFLANFVQDRLLPAQAEKALRARTQCRKSARGPISRLVENATRIALNAFRLASSAPRITLSAACLSHPESRLLASGA